MYKNSFFRQVLLGLTALLAVSCDKDFNEIGSNIIGDDHYNFERHTNEIAANSVGTGVVQSNNLPVNPLGIYDNPVFGRTKANFVTQVELATPNPTIGTNIVMQSVTLSIPYFSHVVTNNNDGTKTYEIDSLLGTTADLLDLKVYRSGYFLGDVAYEGTTQVVQKYYSDQNADIDGVKHPEILNDGPNSENVGFFFNPAEIEDMVVSREGDTSYVKTGPALRLQLNKTYFKTNVLDASAANLHSNNAFKNYFRGLYFKVANSGASAGALALLDFSKGTVTIKYTSDITTTGAGGVSTTTNGNRSLVLNLKGNTVSLLETVPSLEYQGALAQPFSEENGQSRLYLKGGEGSIATIDIFGNADSNGDGTPDLLESIRNNNWLINEASLTFYVDREAMGSNSSSPADRAPEPNRLYLYDIANRRPILDYNLDNITVGDTKFNKPVFGGIMEKSTDGRGTKYKIRVTNYVRSLVGNDSTYVRLGLAVSEDISMASMAKLRSSNEYLKDYVPVSSVSSPVGVVLYGSNIPNTDPNNPDSDYYKRARLEIYYTQPINND